MIFEDRLLIINFNLEFEILFKPKPKLINLVNFGKSNNLNDLGDL